MAKIVTDDELAYFGKNGHPTADVIYSIANELGIPHTKAAEGTEVFHNWARAVWQADYHDQTDDTTEARNAQIDIAKTFLG